MGFLKRFFSIRSKRDKKKRPQQESDATPVDSGLQPIQEEEQEAVVSRLLRSSSARFAVVSELDYASLPPLPHPINNVIQTPAASTISLASTGTTQRGTYTVTVHRRKRHASTEFPNANRDLDEFTTPQQQPSGSERQRDATQLLGLRSDPSVASLLNMYDEHGQLPARAFSNTPPEGRAQTRRSGSTLRQLLGNPSSLNTRDKNFDSSAVEGDISWAERFLGETDSASSTSSLGLRTPNDPDTHFPNDPLYDGHNDNTFSTDHDLSNNAPENPAISSMEVELSLGAESPPLPNNHNPYENPNPMTPQRASQVFDFLTDKRRSRNLYDSERPLPMLPSTFSSPSDEDAPYGASHSHFSSDSSSDSIAMSNLSQTSEIPIPRLNDTPHIPQLQLSTIQALPQSFPLPLARSRSASRSSDYNANTDNVLEGDVHSDSHDGTSCEATPLHDVKVIMNGPTKVIVTAPTPSNTTTPPAPSQIPRGPRALPTKRINEHEPTMRHTFGNQSNSNPVNSDSSKDPFTPIPQRQRKAHNRTASQASTSTSSLIDPAPDPPTRSAEKVIRSKRDGGRSILAEFEKENQSGPLATAQGPITPIRSNSNSNSRSSLFHAAVNPGLFRPPLGMTPSPASSSELSPVGQQLMMDLRQQRMKAREAERNGKKGRFGSGRVGTRGQ